ncbi:MAG: MFS transporter [Aliidongia sp.]
MNEGLAPAGPETFQFASDERPRFPGSPFVPAHPAWRRAAYGCVALCTGIGATFSNGLVSVNISSIPGFLGLYIAQASLLPAIYVAMNASANLTLVKARAQFGIPAVTRGLLTLYVVADLVQLWHPGFLSAVVVRAVDGMTAASLVTVTIYYLTEVFPPKLRPLAPVIGIGLTQLGLPLARLVPLELLVADQWRGLALIELAVPLGLLALIMTFRLPPSERSKAFQPLDLITIGLVVPAMLPLVRRDRTGAGSSGGSTRRGWAGHSLAPSPLFCRGGADRNPSRHGR